MSAKEMICKNCKYHYIDELTFDYPQSCCSKRSEITEQWCKCNDFEYGDRYIEQLQQENKEYKEVIDKVKEKIEKELKENNHLSYGVALSIIVALNYYEEILKGETNE